MEEKYRRTGRTTRLIDGLIQELFKTSKIKVYDHWPTRQSHERVFKMILKRLSLEHPGLILKVDGSSLTIEILK